MNRRLKVALAATAAFGIGTAGVVATAGAAAKPKKNEIVMRGKLDFRAGESVRDNQRFIPHNAKVKSGATVSLRNKSQTKDAHTISFVRKAFLPTGLESATVDAIFAAHQPEGDEGPFFAKIDDGVPAADQSAPLAVNTLGTDTTVGDSEFIAPGQKRTKFVVTAEAGSKLFYFCVIHTWMQGKITVK